MHEDKIEFLASTSYTIAMGKSVIFQINSTNNKIYWNQYNKYMEYDTETCVTHCVFENETHCPVPIALLPSVYPISLLSHILMPIIHCIYMILKLVNKFCDKI